MCFHFVCVHICVWYAVCVCVCACWWTCTCIQMCVEAHGLLSGTFLHHSPPRFIRAVSAAEPGPFNSPGSQLSLRILCLYLKGAGITGGLPYTKCWGFQLQASCLHSKHCTHRNHTFNWRPISIFGPSGVLVFMISWGDSFPMTTASRHHGQRFSIKSPHLWSKNIIVFLWKTTFWTQGYF